MAIIPLKKVTIAGITGEKREVLGALQNLGVIHLIDVSPQPVTISPVNPFASNRAALAYLETCPQRQRPLRKLPKNFKPDLTIQQILKLKERSELLKDESERLQRQIEHLSPWGDFQMPSREELHGLQLFFYVVAARFLRKFDELELPYAIVNQDARYQYVAVVAESIPDLPFSPVALPSESLSQLQEKLENILDEMERCETRRIGETRLIDLLRDHLNRSLDDLELMTASEKTYDDRRIFALQGWCPVVLMTSLENLVQERSLALEIADPTAEDVPPTYIENHELMTPGESLIRLYGTPGYHSWDPTVMVYISFIFFFSMILSDAGYGAIILLSVLLFRSRIVESLNVGIYRLGLALGIGSTFYGVISGAYFGWTPKEKDFLHHLMVFDSADLENLPVLMAASIIIGCAHICIANLVSLYQHRRSQKAIAHFGWIVVVISSLTAWLAQFFWHQPTLANQVLHGIGIGLGLVLLFTNPAPLTLKGLFFRFAGGFEQVLQISKVFGDVLSYLRLFALGLSSTYLAITFNQLAHDAWNMQPAGFLLSFLIIVFGHAVNFALGLMAGLIHGLRLNFIEFYGWSNPEEGFQFNPFRKTSRN